MKKYFITLTLICFAQTSFADILFFNFNGNTSSIEAAKKAAIVRGEKVIVYPNQTIKEITPKNLDKIFKEISSKKISVSNLTMSGHDGGGHFAGKDGDISKEDIRKSVEKYPAIKNSVSSLLLRGCYSATMGQVQSQSIDDWRNIFPHAKFIAGYNDPAESSERSPSKHFVEDMLKLEHEFLQDNTLADVTHTFKKVGEFNQMDAAVWLRQCESFGANKGKDGIYLTSDMAGQNHKPVLIAEERKRCEQSKSQLLKSMDVFWKYYTGAKGHERPPKEHQGTDLRAAYSFIRQNEHCIPILMPEKATAYSPDRIIRLIYFDYLVSNFKDQYPSSGISKIINHYIKGAELAGLKYPDLEKISRTDLATYVSRIEGAATKLYNEGKGPNDPKTIAGMKLWKHAQAMDASLSTIYPFHVPFSWVSEAHSGAPLNGLH